ncbi:MAG: 50S ribosomal protein L9 [Saprospiraceae bacterium]|nr:50S ribosomal protein L9 [Saprospiraceae bacterium]
MEVILLQDVDKVGDKYDVVTVKPGYGRNFLIPKGMAKIANQANMAELDNIRAAEAAQEEARRAEYEAVAAQLKGKVIKIGAKAGASGKIFGSVTTVQLAAALKDQLQIDIPRKKIEIVEEVKELGTYTAQINLHKEIVANLSFDVIAE